MLHPKNKPGDDFKPIARVNLGNVETLHFFMLRFVRFSFPYCDSAVRMFWSGLGTKMVWLGLGKDRVVA